jgi:hypothetical protein
VVTRELIGHEARVDLGEIGGLWGKNLEISAEANLVTLGLAMLGEVELAVLGR